MTEQSVNYPDVTNSIKCDLSYTPLSSDEMCTVVSILKNLDASSRVDVGPLHGFSESGDFTGFKLTSSGSSFVCHAPFCEKMFFGVSVCAVECNDMVLSNFLKNKVDYERKLRDMVDGINASIDSGVAVAGFDCIPEEYAGFCKETKENISVRGSYRKGVDSKQWTPEPPQSIGVYHSYVRLASGDRASRLFVVCEGGCDSLCMEYFNLMFDLRESTTLGEAVSSEETWWVQNACSRARCRLLYMACEALNLECKNVVSDVYSYEERKTVVPINETLHFDFFQGRGDKVVMMNGLVDTQRLRNGICCRMGKKEGYWIFRGSSHRSGNVLFGGPFGYKDHTSLFPVWNICKRGAKTHEKEVFFENDILQYFTKTGWNRDWGISELVPLCTYDQTDCP